MKFWKNAFFAPKQFVVVTGTEFDQESTVLLVGNSQRPNIGMHASAKGYHQDFIGRFLWFLKGAGAEARAFSVQARQSCVVNFWLQRVSWIVSTRYCFCRKKNFQLLLFLLHTVSTRYYHYLFFLKNISFACISSMCSKARENFQSKNSAEKIGPKKTKKNHSIGSILPGPIYPNGPDSIGSIPRIQL